MNTMIQLARIQESISHSQYIIIVNRIIQNNPAQADLVALKQKLGFLDYIGVVGTGYWCGFVKRDRDMIASKNSNNFDINCVWWSTYANFSQMYD